MCKAYDIYFLHRTDCVCYKCKLASHLVRKAKSEVYLLDTRQVIRENEGLQEWKRESKKETK